eukprot:m.138789 g.138789  ORF g.138789 m.138789 type:complete len:81 (+) comp38259_c0_seq3:1833-2075(+)
MLRRRLLSAITVATHSDLITDYTEILGEEEKETDDVQALKRKAALKRKKEVLEDLRSHPSEPVFVVMRRSTMWRKREFQA